MDETEDPKQRLRLALELYEYAEAIMRENLRRDYPHASPAEIEIRLLRWVSKRPAADEAGSPVSLGSP